MHPRALLVSGERTAPMRVQFSVGVRSHILGMRWVSARVASLGWMLSPAVGGAGVDTTESCVLLRVCRAGAGRLAVLLMATMVLAGYRHGARTLLLLLLLGSGVVESERAALLGCRG